MTEDLDWELIVIGGGPAGMTAAIYGARYGLKTLLLEAKVLGGAQATSPGIENYPGFTFIVGMDLATRMKEQVKKCGAQIREITEVKSIRHDSGHGSFVLETRRGNYKAQAIILATGGGHKKLNVPGEEELTGKGVSYCATCDGPLFRGKTVAVIGGGNTAVTEALYLSELAQTVYLIHRRGHLRAEKAMQDNLAKSPVQIIWEHLVKGFRGDQQLQEIAIENAKTGEVRTLPVNAAFVALGSNPESGIVKTIDVETNKTGEIITDKLQRTNVPGVFAAGDVVESMKQIAVAVGQGAIAADSAYRYIRGERHGPR
jgi:thioredoxin reductase (NADPH)